jgi:hypothetical protein
VVRCRIHGDEGPDCSRTWLEAFDDVPRRCSYRSRYVAPAGCAVVGCIQSSAVRPAIQRVREP